MSKQISFTTFLVATAVFSVGLLFNGNVGNVVSEGQLVAKADAHIIKRRHHHHHRHPVRRVVRSAIYISTLPPRCTVVIFNNIRYYSCRGKYYQPYRGRYVLVYVN
jgi:hypothetical protein